MSAQEEKVLLSACGYGRVAIVRRPDGLFCLYQHWRWPPASQSSFGVTPVEDRRWSASYDPRLYDVTDPLPGIYGIMAEAEREATSLLGLAAW